MKVSKQQLTNVIATEQKILQRIRKEKWASQEYSDGMEYILNDFIKVFEIETSDLKQVDTDKTLREMLNF